MTTISVDAVRHLHSFFQSQARRSLRSARAAAGMEKFYFLGMASANQETADEMHKLLEPKTKEMQTSPHTPPTVAIPVEDRRPTK